MKNAKGFSLIELLIVVVILGVIAAIAIPNLIVARRAGNEGSAISSLRLLHGANMMYAATSGSGEFAGLAATPGTSALTELSNIQLIDRVLGSGSKSNYMFTANREIRNAAAPATFYFSANPVSAASINRGGNKRFGVATNGVLKYDATPADLATPFDESTLSTALAVAN